MSDEMRAMDAEVAEKVMGWSKVESDSVSTYGRPPSGEDTEYAGAGGGYSHVPRFSTDIKAAWEVHKAMCNRLLSVRLRYLAAIQEQADAVLHVIEPARSVAGLHVLVVLRDTMAEAICRAAMKAIAA